MNIIDKIFNRDIYCDLKDNILDYQNKLFFEADKRIKKYDLHQWMKSGVFFSVMEIPIIAGIYHYSR